MFARLGNERGAVLASDTGIALANRWSPTCTSSAWFAIFESFFSLFFRVKHKKNNNRNSNCRVTNARWRLCVWAPSLQRRCFVVLNWDYFFTHRFNKHIHNDRRDRRDKKWAGVLVVAVFCIQVTSHWISTVFRLTRKLLKSRAWKKKLININHHVT